MSLLRRYREEKKNNKNKENLTFACPEWTSTLLIS
jgi:hypothetical protein